MGQNSFGSEVFDVAADTQFSSPQPKLVSDIFDRQSHNEWRALFVNNEESDAKTDSLLGASPAFLHPESEVGKTTVDPELSKQFKELLAAIPEQDRAQYIKDTNEYFSQMARYLMSGGKGQQPEPSAMIKKYEQLSKQIIQPSSHGLEAC